MPDNQIAEEKGIIPYGNHVDEFGLDDAEHDGAQRAPGSAIGADPQALQRYIGLSSIVNFGLVILDSWEAVALTFQFALLNGGPASMIYGSILGGFGATAIAMSLAELAAVDPTVGAQYRWSANLAPAGNRFWGLMQGWITMFAWMAAAAVGPAALANVVTALAVFNHPDYTPKRWHTAFIMWGFILVPFIFNLWFRKLLDVFELLGGVLHFAFFIVALVVLAVMGKRSTADYVFTTLTTGISGWDNSGVAFGLGLLTVTTSLNGFDGILHMSDEIKHVHSRAPRSIIIAAVSNSIMVFALVVTLLFTVGDVDKVTSSFLPIIEVFYEATGSVRFTNFLVSMPAIITFFAVFNIFASVSRLTWQFAKDKGLPFSRRLSYVNPSLGLPLNALMLVTFITFLLATIFIASSTAFNAIVSLQALALYVSYVAPITFVMIRRLRGIPMAPNRYRMSRIGLPVNLFALAFLIYGIIWMPFPQLLPVTGSNMNYAGPVLGGVMLIALADWFTSGHRRFQVPVAPSTI